MHTMTYRWHITNLVSGAYLGCYEGDTIAEMHDSMCRDAGYASAQDCADTLGTTVEALLSDIIAEQA